MIAWTPQPGELTDEQVFGAGAPQAAPGAAPPPQVQAAPRLRPGEMSDAEVFGTGESQPRQAQPQTEPFANATPAQQAYAYANQNSADPTAAPGSPGAPYYDTASSQGAPGTNHVTLQGKLSAPAPANGFLDAIESGPTGLVNGGAMITGAAGNFRNLAGGAAEGVANGVSKLVGGDPNAFTGMSHGLSSAMPLNAFKAGPSEGDVVGAVQNGSEYRFHQPQTTLGRLAERLGEFAPGAAMPGTAFARAAPFVQGAASWGASEAARAAGHPELDPYVSALAALAAGHAANVPLGSSGTSKVLNAATRGVSDQDLMMAQAIQAHGEKIGVPVGMSEALNQVTGNRTNLARVQQMVEQTPSGSAVIKPIIDARPAAMQGALEASADTIAPPTAQPDMVGLQAQRAAQGAIRNVEQARTQAVTPDYTAAGAQNVDPEAMRGFLSDLDQHIASDRTGILAKPLSALRSRLVDQDATDAAQAQAASPRADLERSWAQITGEPVPDASPSGPVPITDIENLDRVRKFVRDDTASQLDRGRMTPEQGSALTGYADRLDQMMEDTSDAYRQGKATYAALSGSSVEPLTAGPIGRIAATPNLASQTSALYPTKPFPGADSQTAAGVEAMNAVDPGAAAALTRQHFLQTGSEAMQDNAKGPNPYGGAAFAAGIRGNPLQRQNLDAGITASAGPDVAADVSRTLDVFDATGRRLPATQIDPALVQALLKPNHYDPTEGLMGANVGMEALGGPVGAGVSLGARGLASGVNWLNAQRAKTAARGLATTFYGPSEATPRVIYDARTQAQRDDENMARLLMGTYAGLDQPR